MKRKNRCYCIQCLRKFYLNNLAAGDLCPFCMIPVRFNTRRIVAQVVTRLRRYRGIDPPKKKDDYQEYLASEKWKVIRSRILERDHHQCQACPRPAKVVHHKSYHHEVLDGKRDSDLVSLCIECHSEIEFKIVDGRRIKNKLRHANQKLEAKMQKHTAILRNRVLPSGPAGVGV